MVRGLLVIDFQEEWRTPGSAAYLGAIETPVRNAAALVAAARSARISVLFTRHIEPPGSPIFAPASAGIRIMGELAPLASERVFEKNKISPFYRTGLEEHLARSGVDELVVSGIMTNLCVRSAVADAYDRGIGLSVATDACASDSETTDRFTLDDLQRTRPEVRMRTTAELIAEFKG